MRLLFSFALLVAAVETAAQEQPTAPLPWPKAHHGPRIGFGLATQSTGALFGNSSNLLFGPIAGWHFEAPLHPQMILTPEVLYMTKGFLIRNPALGVRERSVYRYLEVPLLLKVSTDRVEDGMFLLLGPSAGYYLGGRYQRWQNGELNTDVDLVADANTRRLQFSVLVGLGAEGPKWGFDVRAQTSLTPFDSVQRLQNVVYALTLAYRIGGRPSPPAEE